MEDRCAIALDGGDAPGEEEAFSQLRKLLGDALRERAYAGCDLFYAALRAPLEIEAAETALALREEIPFLRLVAVCAEGAGGSPELCARREAVEARADGAVSFAGANARDQTGRFLLERCGSAILISAGPSSGALTAQAEALGRDVTLIFL